MNAAKMQGQTAFQTLSCLSQYKIRSLKLPYSFYITCILMYNQQYLTNKLIFWTTTHNFLYSSPYILQPTPGHYQGVPISQ